MEEALGTLKDGKVVLGLFYPSQDSDFPGYDQDFPFVGYSFEATPAFSKARALFDAVLRAGEKKDGALEMGSWKQINDLQLILQLNAGNKKFMVKAPLGPNETISLFENQQNALLYIDSKAKKAWFRLW
jgi:hypothetical protein